jgi:hypothetical protein
METDAASAQDVVVVVVCIRRKKPFSHLLRLLGSPLNLDFFFFVLLHSHSLCVCTCSCRGGLVEGMLLKSIEKPKKISFGSPLFLLLRKQLRSCMSTTRRLANTLIPQQQLDCNFCSRVC